MDRSFTKKRGYVIPKKHIFSFILKEGHYDNVGDVTQQMLLQMRKVFATVPLPQRPNFQLKIKASSDQPVYCVRYAYFTEDATHAELFGNAALTELLHFAERDPRGDIFARYMIIEHKMPAFSGVPGGPPEDTPLMVTYTTDIYKDPKTFQERVQQGLINHLLPHHTFRQITHGTNHHFYSSIHTSIHQESFKLTDLNDPFPQDPKNQPQRFYVYANFIQERYLGSQQKPLLCILHNPGIQAQKYSPVYTQTFLDPTYMATQPGFFPRLHVWIEDEHGNIHPFQEGTTHLSLHFRKNAPCTL